MGEKNLVVNSVFHLFTVDYQIQCFCIAPKYNIIIMIQFILSSFCAAQQRYHETWEIGFIGAWNPCLSDKYFRCFMSGSGCLDALSLSLHLFILHFHFRITILWIFIDDDPHRPFWAVYVDI